MTMRRIGSKRSAFTLLEVLIVVALLVLLLGVGITNLDRIFGERQKEVAEIFVHETIRTPLHTFRLDVGRYPTTEEGLEALISAPEGVGDRWRGPYLERREVPDDPWGNPYQYRFPGEENPDSYDIYSYGPDGRDSEQNIGNW